MAGAPQSLGTPDNTQTYLIIGGGLELSIHSTAAGTGFMEVDADGTVKKVYPP